MSTPTKILPELIDTSSVPLFQSDSSYPEMLDHHRINIVYHTLSNGHPLFTFHQLSDFVAHLYQATNPHEEFKYWQLLCKRR